MMIRPVTFSCVVFSVVLLLATGIAGAATEPDMPKGLWEAFSEARHLIEPEESDGVRTFHAQSPKNQLVFRFGERGLTVKPGVPNQDWMLTMELAAFGQEGSLAPVAPAELTAEGRRIEYRRGGLTEWYVNDPRGLEQGFTIERPGGYDPARPVVLSLRFDGGLTAAVDGDGMGVSFATPDGGHAFDYKGLKAFDAEGVELPAELVLADGRLDIRLEVGAGPWPVTVDPVISTETKLDAYDDAAGDDNFGYSVSVSGDTALIGSRGDDSNTGAAYVFVRSGSTWSFQAKLRAPTPVGGEEFGYSVAVSGDYTVVGAPNGDGADFLIGVAYVFVRSAGVWSYQDTLQTIEGNPGDRFGQSVSISGDYAIVGAPYHDDLVYGFEDSGSAFVFARSGATWNQSAWLQALGTSPYDYFGQSVSISGGTAVVGFPGIGSAHVYLWSGSAWNLQQQITPSSGADFVSIDGETTVVGDSGAVDVFLRTSGSWASQATLSVSGAVSASISGDTTVIGVPGSEAAYVYLRTGTSWSLQATLTDSDGLGGDEFGYSVSVSGDTAVVGAYKYTENNPYNGDFSGSAYVFSRSGTTWSEQKKLLAVVVANDKFGYSVCIAGDTALIGAINDDDAGPNSGSAYVFVRSGTSWSQQAKLVASDPGISDEFGSSVSIAGDTALVGAWGDDDGGASSGSVYVFVRSGTNWSQQAKLTASDAATGDFFGTDVSIAEDTALVGAYYDTHAGGSESGSAYVFLRSGTSWSQQAKLTASDAAANDYFGSSVSIEGDTALVGASSDDHIGGFDSGSAYVFVRSGTSWSQQAKLTASDAGEWDYFGADVSVAGDTALVGETANFGGGIGSAYVFVRLGTVWAEQQKLTAFDEAANDSFGFSVSLQGSTALVGAPFDDDGGAESGSAYIFVRGGTGWLESAKLTASDAAPDAEYGNSVSVSGDIALVGARHHSVEGILNAGSAYANRFECGFGGGIAPGRWTMIGIPCDMGASNTVEDVFGDNLTPAQYGLSWVLYKRDEATDRYVRLNLTSILELGEGYWLKSSNWGVWDVSGSLTQWVQSGLCSSPKGCYEVTLVPPATPTSGYRPNLVGHPGNKSTDWSAVGVLVDGSLYTPSDAEAAGYVSKTIFKYNGSAYDSYDDATPGLVGTLESQEGIWVLVQEGASGHTVKLLIPDGNPLGGPPIPPKVMDGELVPTKGKPPTRIDEWYVRLIAETPAEGLYDTRNVLGQLIGSEDGFDTRDLPEMAPFATPYLTIVFPHEDWGEHAGDYASDFHSPDWKQADQWVFQVKSDSPWRDVRLAWENLTMLQSLWSHENNQRQWTTHRVKSGEALMAKMWLEDMDTGDLVKVAEDGVPTDYWFNMDGQTVRTFRWVLKGKGNRVAPSRDLDNRDPASAADALGLPPNDLENPPRPGRGNF